MSLFFTICSLSSIIFHHLSFFVPVLTRIYVSPVLLICPYFSLFFLVFPYLSIICHYLSLFALICPYLSSFFLICHYLSLFFPYFSLLATISPSLSLCFNHLSFRYLFLMCPYFTMGSFNKLRFTICISQIRCNTIKHNSYRV